MNGEPTVPPPQPPRLEARGEPLRPSCAIHLGNALGEKDPVKRGLELEQANEHSRDTTIDKCLNCLGRPAVDIVCPLPGPQHPKGQKFDLQQDKLDEILKELEGARIRLRKLLTKNGSPTSNPVFDTIIRRVLHFSGIPQIGSIKAPHPSAVDQRPEPNNTESRAPNHPNKVNLAYEGVLEERPECASRLRESLAQRALTIEQWSIHNLPLDKRFRQPIDHSISERTYARAIDLTKQVDEENCASCLRKDLCPLVNGVKLKKLYDTTNKTSHLSSGLELKTQDVIVEITRGRPKTSLPQDALNKTEDKLYKRALEASAA